MRCERVGREFGVSDADAAGVPVRVVGGLDSEACLDGCRRDELDDGADVGERLAAPVHRDERQQAVFDLLPLRGAGRVVNTARDPARCRGGSKRAYRPLSGRSGVVVTGQQRRVQQAAGQARMDWTVGSVPAAAGEFDAEGKDQEMC